MPARLNKALPAPPADAVRFWKSIAAQNHRATTSGTVLIVGAGMAGLTAANVLKAPDAGRIAAELPADLLVIPGSHDRVADALVAASRADVRCVVVGGTPMVGDASMSAAFAGRRVTTARVTVDGVERLAAKRLVRPIARCTIWEPARSHGCSARAAVSCRHCSR